MAKEFKTLTIQELKDGGYLQEVNRQFFHPLGLALVLSVNNEDDEQVQLSIGDFREDPEGVYFDFKNRTQEQLLSNKAKADKVEKERFTKSITRIKQLGFDIEPI